MPDSGWLACWPRGATNDRPHPDQLTHPSYPRCLSTALLPPSSLLPILTSLVQRHPQLKPDLLALLPQPSLAVALDALRAAETRIRSAVPFGWDAQRPGGGVSEHYVVGRIQESVGEMVSLVRRSPTLSFRRVSLLTLRPALWILPLTGPVTLTYLPSLVRRYHPVSLAHSTSASPDRPILLPTTDDGPPRPVVDFAPASRGHRRPLGSALARMGPLGRDGRAMGQYRGWHGRRGCR